MKIFTFLIFFISFVSLTFAQNQFITPFEQSNRTETATYSQGISFFEQLDKSFTCIKLLEYGKTDSGMPLHLAVLSADGDFDIKSLRKKGKSILFINNAIHAGEPDGVDATMMLFRNLAQSLKDKNAIPDFKKLIQNTVIIAIPFYNVGGILNRGSFSRANQNGPKEYGFRGNAKNLDLNRDFIKCDSENAKTFASIFQAWQPDFYIENHVTNGADYQHTITYLATQDQKLGGELGSYLQKNLIPDLATQMKTRGFEMCPYVNLFGETPDKGYNGFLDSPRYSSGYAALFHTLGFIVETHMLKPFAQRVEGTYQFMLSALGHLHKNGPQIQVLRRQSIEKSKLQKDFVIEWTQDKEKFDEIDFKGYEATQLESKVTTGKRTLYDRNKPFEKKVPFYKYFNPKTTVSKPEAYLIPQAWQEVINLLRINGVELKQIAKDTKTTISAYYIEDFKTAQNPFESHYLHYNTQVRKEKQSIQVYAGDWVVVLNQDRNRFIMEVLEPQATDSYFNWNFFDSILQQKEYFSDYVFEDIAEKLLQENQDLKIKFENRKQNDAEFAANPQAQLAFIYYNSPYYEKTHKRYPIFRIEDALNLPLR